MRLAFQYDKGNGIETTVVGPMAIIGYEQENRTKISRLAESGVGMGDMTELVWRQRKLEGHESESLEEFRLSLLDIDPVAVADPTQLREEV